MVPAGVNSSDNSYTPMMVAFISDAIPEHQQTIAYSTGYAFSARGLFAGVGTAIGVSLAFGDEANFIVIAAINAVTLAYVYFVAKTGIIVFPASK